jgi:B-box zinc finger
MPSAPTAAAARCRNHPEQPAVAICVRCGKPVCAACSTRWEGMHHCISCLAARRAAAGERGATLRTLGMVLLALALAAGVTLLRAVAGAAIARLF